MASTRSLKRNCNCNQCQTTRRRCRRGRQRHFTVQSADSSTSATWTRATLVTCRRTRAMRTFTSATQSSTSATCRSMTNRRPFHRGCFLTNYAIQCHHQIRCRNQAPCRTRKVSSRCGIQCHHSNRKPTPARLAAPLPTRDPNRRRS